MMGGFAALIMKGRLQAIILVTVMAFVGVFIPPVSYLAGAAIALVTLRLGFGEGIIVVAGGAAGVALLGMAAGIAPTSSIQHVLMLGAPVMLVAMVLRQSLSLPLTFQVIALSGVAVVAILMFIGQGWMDEWRAQFEQIVSVAMEAARQQSGQGLTEAELREVIEHLLDNAEGIFATVFVFSQIVILAIARNWQAKLYNPGGFSKEFQELRLGKVTAIVSLLVVLAATALPEQTVNIFSRLLGIVMILYLVQFLAVTHAVIAGMEKSRGWLVSVYVLVMIGMFAFPPLLMVMIMTGFADTWVNFRGHIKKA